jgi:hypothetical protein
MSSLARSFVVAQKQLVHRSGQCRPVVRGAQTGRTPLVEGEDASQRTGGGKPAEVVVSLDVFVEADANEIGRHDGTALIGSLEPTRLWMNTIVVAGPVTCQEAV